MEVDTLWFFVQGLAGLLGGLIGATLLASLTGLFKVKGEITGRGEKIDLILNEVKLTAKATALSTIEARTERIKEIVNEVAQSTMASEGAKIAIRLQELDQILQEVRAVTETQKRIEANIAGGEWDRQWRLNQMREAYGRLLAAVYYKQHYYSYNLLLANSPDAVSCDVQLSEPVPDYWQIEPEYQSASALTRIFAGSRATNALNEYDKRTKERLAMSESSLSQFIEDLYSLRMELIQAARDDLDVSVENNARNECPFGAPA